MADNSIKHDNTGITLVLIAKGVVHKLRLQQWEGERGVKKGQKSVNGVCEQTQI